ncbi:tyrosine-type recombinase/integrase [Tropicibacter sp. R16_0]|uniref:tyrosine-type recombinase/integrase n=1 Tax=Tropicibacter sp. R16_0 TaxID=2821102 RepID=UPI001ADB3175|nr:tyrosine-type recombinase/integrase [Tropicibacter sp. R16_0]MBO9452284.1 tyrosine-type recombinase/integrase [Tropicibacter sp. R16_0]
MRYIEQPRGQGTAYRFRMKTPAALVGREDPQTGKPFGTWIIRSLGGERHLPTAKKLRDMRLAEVRAIEASYRASERFSQERAELWAEALQSGGAAGGHSPAFVRDLIYDEIKAAPERRREGFRKVALSNTLALPVAVERYLSDRAPGNGFGYAPLKQTSINDLHTAIRYLADHIGREANLVFLTDVSREDVIAFRGEYLPAQTSKKTGKGLSIGTIDKLTTMLRGLWRWALDHKKLPDGSANPFDLPRGVRRAKQQPEQQRDQYQPPETQKVLAAAPVGSRLGDVFRLALVTGARATEIVKVRVEDADEDGSLFYIADGKTANAQRVVPVPEVARPIIQRLRADAMAGGHDRLFHAYSLKPSTGNASSLSQEFTRVRRKVLGRGTDGRLSFHSLRHTWRTTARRAGLSVDDTHDLGGWSAPSKTSDPYDHGLQVQELAKEQEKVTALLQQDGHLVGY